MQDRQLYEAVIGLRQQGSGLREAARTVAAAHELNADSVRKRAMRYADKAGLPIRPEASPVFDGRLSKLAELVPTPRYTGWGHYEVEEGIFIGDVHSPLADWDFSDKMFTYSHKRGVKRLFILGDLLNADAFSLHPQLVPQIDFRSEMASARLFMEACLDIFDTIVYRLGNHEQRLWKALGGDFASDDFMRMLGAFNARIDASVYTQVEITSGNQKWRATHQRNYSRIRGRVANTLAQKFQASIMCFHQHGVAKVIDDYGRYVCIDGGGLFDQEKMAYVNLVDSTSPTMVNGFIHLQDGAAELLTPYPAFTNQKAWA